MRNKVNSLHASRTVDSVTAQVLKQCTRRKYFQGRGRESALQYCKWHACTYLLPQQTKAMQKQWQRRSHRKRQLRQKRSRWAPGKAREMGMASADRTTRGTLPSRRTGLDTCRSIAVRDTVAHRVLHMLTCNCPRHLSDEQSDDDVA